MAALAEANSESCQTSNMGLFPQKAPYLIFDSVLDASLKISHCRYSKLTIEILEKGLKNVQS